MNEEELKQLQDNYNELKDNYKQLQDNYKTLKESNDANIQKITDYEKNIETLRNDKKMAEDRYTDLFKQTILVPKKEEPKKEEEPEDSKTMKIEDLYII